MGLCLRKEERAEIPVPCLDLTKIEHGDEVAVPYQDTWIEGELKEFVDEDTVIAELDFGTPVVLKIKVTKVADIAPPNIGADGFPVRVKMKPISWEKEGVELLVEVRKRSADTAEPFVREDRLFE